MLGTYKMDAKMESGKLVAKVLELSVPVVDVP